MTSIPASTLVNIIPGVLGAGGSPLSLNAVFLTDDPAVPVGTLDSFATADDVSDFFGSSSEEARLAGVYFQGYEGCTDLPFTLYFYQMPIADVAAYLRGGAQADLDAVKALGSGTITIVIDGTSTVSAAINLSGATSLSNAAALIQTGLRAGTPSNTHSVTYDAQRGAFKITSSSVGSPGSTIAYPTTAAFATGLKLTAATNAVLSQGADAADPETIMDSVTALTQNFATFTTVFEASDANLLGLATWVTGSGDRYVYVGWDTDTGPTLSSNDTDSFGRLTETFDGVIPVFDLQLGNVAAFICGAIGAINFARLNGRITLAYKSLAGLSADVTNATVASNLIANGYNFYGSYATANQAFTFLQPGQISGDWSWIDSYVNQIYLNSQFQLAFMELLSNVNSIPYNQDGYNLIRAAAQDPINEAVNFGSIRAGVQLSSSQTAQVNSAAGVRISDVLTTQGWYLQILDPGAIARGLRETPTCTFWYMDGSSVQKITLSSIDIL